MNRGFAVSFIVLAGSFAFAASASAKMDSNKFLTQAAQGGKAEVKLSQLALQKADNQDVKQFAQRMIDDHTKMNQQVSDMASQKNITLPDTPSRAQQAEYNKLSKLSGKKFDKEFMSYNVKDHTKDVRDFRKQAAQGTDPDVKQMAAQAVPELQGHLQMARNVDKVTK